VNNDRELVSRLSFEIMKEVAPDEIDLFQDIEEEFFKNPAALLEQDTKKKEKMLGFSVPPGVEQLFTIFILPVVLGIIEKFLNRRTNEKISEDDMNEIREAAYKNALSLGLKKERAGILADSMVGKIAQMGLA